MQDVHVRRRLGRGRRLCARCWCARDRGGSRRCRGRCRPAAARQKEEEEGGARGDYRDVPRTHTQQHGVSLRRPRELQRLPRLAAAAPWSVRATRLPPQ
jgi:hypothetical protein